MDVYAMQLHSLETLVCLAMITRRKNDDRNFFLLCGGAWISRIENEKIVKEEWMEWMEKE
eukprot:1013147-Ditylum_brightwellii.AAC.1